MLPLPVPADGDIDVAVFVVVVAGRGEVEVGVGAAVLATTAGFKDVELVEEELVVEATAGVAEAAQAHTALADFSTARPVTAPQPLRTPVRAAVLMATVGSHESIFHGSMMRTNVILMVHIDMRSL